MDTETDKNFTPEQLESIRRALMPSERIWDRELCVTLGDIQIPFGKYIGTRLSGIPLNYLDQTIGSMPSSWLVRRVNQFVDMAMGSYENFKQEATNQVPRLSFDQIMEAWENEAMGEHEWRMQAESEKRAIEEAEKAANERCPA